MTDKRDPFLLIILFVLTFAYFFQGGGWNQNSHFALVRSIVENQSFEITPFASSTQDISQKDGKIFSNKAPGLALLASLPYFLIINAEKLLGIDPLSVSMLNFNAHLLSIFSIGIPAALLVYLMYLALLNKKFSANQSFLLATVFGLGTLILPYTGTLMTAVLIATLLFSAWYFLFIKTPSAYSISAAGILLGIGLLSEYSTIPLAFILIALFLTQKKNRSFSFQVLFGPILALLLIGLYQYLAFGQVFSSSYTFTNQLFLKEELLFGLFALPKLDTIYRITVHPLKGIFFCSPILLLSLCALKNSNKFILSSVAALSVIIYFFTLNLSIHTWTAGWGVGPRYMIPAIPFLFYYATEGYRLVKPLFLILALYSCLLMLAVTAVDTFIPAPLDSAVADPNSISADPFRWSSFWLKHDLVAINSQNILEEFPAAGFPGTKADFWDSYNLGEILGFRGKLSLLPLLLLGFILIISRYEFKFKNKN